MSSIIFGLTCFGISLFHNNNSFLLLRFLSGVSAAVLGPNLWAYCNEVFEQGKREMVTSWMMSAFNLATVLGVPIGLFASGIFGWSDMFLFMGCLSILVSFLFLVYGKQSLKKKTFTFKVHFSNIKKALSLNWKLSLSMFFASASYLSVYPFINPWLASKGGWSVSSETIVFFIIGLTGFVGNIVSGFILQKASAFKISKQVWVIQFFIIIILFGVTYLTKNTFIFIGLTSIWTFLTGIGNTAFISNMGSRGGEIRGSVMALNNSSIFLGFTLGSFIGSKTWGIAQDIWINLLLAVICSLLSIYFIFAKEKQISNNITEKV
ncbi:MFS transporter [Terrilactibacillus sp. S3-3]|nr:MFS transporter [Terrilactibacillus sp. S3-3]